MIAVESLHETQTLNRLILERLAIGKRVGFRYRTLERLGLDVLDCALAQGILRETNRAKTIKHPDPFAPTIFDLEVRRGENGFYAISADGDERVPPVPLMEDDLRQFELVLSRLCRRICIENAIEDQYREHARETFFLGERELDGFGLRPVYLLCGTIDESRFIDRCREITGSRGWTVVLTPTAVGLSPSNRRYLAEMNVLLAPMAHYLADDAWKLPWGRITAGFSGQEKTSQTYQPVADLSFDHLPGLTFSPDFRVVYRRGKPFVLTESMVRVIKFMVENSPHGARDISQQRILEESECRSKSLVYIFKNLPEWKELLTPGTKKGTYRLNL